MTGDGMGLFAAIGMLTVPLGPLVLAAGLANRRLRPLCSALTPWAALPAVAVAMLAPANTLLEIPPLLLGTRLGLDETGRAFLLFTGLLWWLAGLFGARYMAGDPRRARFFAFYLLAMSGSLGLNLCLDPASFFLLFALMSFTSYGLVVHSGDAEAMRAGRVYIALVVLGEVLLISAIAIVVSAGVVALPYREAAAPGALIALVLVGFGIKAGALPLHVWLPLAHPAAPVPASAVLSGAMIKAGLLGWLRFLPLGTMAAPEWGLACATAGLTAAFFGAAVGVTQRNPKTVLAYSSISQMGLMTVPIGIGLAFPNAWPLALTAVLVYALHHGLAKGALFIGVGVVTHAGGLRLPVMLGLLLPALALAGLPLTSGAVAKAALKAAVADSAESWVAWLDLLLPLAAVGTTLLMARFLVTVGDAAAAGNDDEAPGLWPSWLVLLLAVLGLVWFWPMADEAVLAAFEVNKLWPAVWPVALGGAIGWAVWRRTARSDARSVCVPAGDVLALVDAILPPWYRFWSGELWSKIWVTLIGVVGPGRWVEYFMTTLDALSAAEMRLRIWPVAGALFMLVLLLLFALSRL